MRLRRGRSRSPGLPGELAGLRIVHLSDFHLGLPSRGARAVERAVGVDGGARARPRLRDRRPALAPARRAGARPTSSRALPRRARRARQPRLRHRARPVRRADGAARRAAAARPAPRRGASRSSSAAARVQIVGVDPRDVPRRAARGRSGSPTPTPTSASSSATSRASSTLLDPGAFHLVLARPPPRRADRRALLRAASSGSRTRPSRTRAGSTARPAARPPRLARTRHDVRPVPLLRPTGGHRADARPDVESGAWRARPRSPSDILASYAADAAREVEGVRGLVESLVHRAPRRPRRRGGRRARARRAAPRARLGRVGPERRAGGAGARARLPRADGRPRARGGRRRRRGDRRAG